ncbi:hypothetical protein [Natronolimnohabitans innermongolicus]|uniref:Uncharacterized protein n=1 Tax=Natronolimnohabitans innermongolicus JCM 12255 TaxID=1227499 RepID=L9WQ79_9EURY|nr:hypothetical protein [Natronolimnohabitans innermongolicus]ELY51634.1 hypothetical protein C493_16931 [Natronolimnohabitans innermongolicus JCM 12255]
MRRGDRDPGRRRSSSSLTNPSDRLKIAFVALVGLSGGMMALQGGASLQVIGAMVLGGVVVGGALLWYLLWILG